MTAMGLDEREQEILDEIERQFYAEDPKLAAAVRTVSKPSRVRIGYRSALAGALIGLALLVATFTRSPWLALVGFVLMVVSVTLVIQHMRGNSDSGRRGQDGSVTFGSWFTGRRFGRFRRR